MFSGGNMVRIKSFKIRESKSIALPRVWLTDLGLKPGDKLDVFQDNDNRLVIVSPRHEEQSRDGLRDLAKAESGGAA